MARAAGLSGPRVFKSRTSHVAGGWRLRAPARQLRLKLGLYFVERDRAHSREDAAMTWWLMTLIVWVAGIPSAVFFLSVLAVGRDRRRTPVCLQRRRIHVRRAGLIRRGTCDRPVRRRSRLARFRG